MEKKDALNVYKLIDIEKKIYRQYQKLMEFVKANRKYCKEYNQIIENIEMLKEYENKKAIEFFKNTDSTFLYDLNDYFRIENYDFLEQILRSDSQLCQMRVINLLNEQIYLPRISEFVFNDACLDEIFIDQRYDPVKQELLAKKEYTEKLWEIKAGIEKKFDFICGIDNSLTPKDNYRDDLILAQYNLCFTDPSVENLFIQTNFNFCSIKNNDNYILCEHPDIDEKEYYEFKEKYDYDNIIEVIDSINEQISVLNDKKMLRLIKIILKSLLSKASNSELAGVLASCKLTNRDCSYINKELTSRGVVAHVFAFTKSGKQKI